MPRTSNTRHSDKIHDDARKLLREMTSLLDDRIVAERIDEAIDSAVASFRFPETVEYDHEAFHGLITRFVRHLRAGMVWGRRKMSHSQAHDEAVSLLERLYDGEHGRGYDGAIADAADPEGRGVAGVLLILAEGIKQHQRGQYGRWVEARCLGGAAWRVRCAAAELLLERCRPMLPATVQGWPAERWADHVFPLLMMDMQTEIAPRG